MTRFMTAFIVTFTPFCSLSRVYSLSRVEGQAARSRGIGPERQESDESEESARIVFPEESVRIVFPEEEGVHSGQGRASLGREEAS